MDEREKVIEWKDTEAGQRVRGKFSIWLNENYPDRDEYPIGLELRAGRWCNFFEETYPKLQEELDLTAEDMNQIFKIWGTQAKITENAWLYQLMRMAF
jgi:hypothetical protein